MGVTEHQGSEYPLKIIRWRDHSTSHAWRAIGERQRPEECAPLMVTSVGWEIARTRELCKLAPNVADQGDCADVTSILLE